MLDFRKMRLFSTGKVPSYNEERLKRYPPPIIFASVVGRCSMYFSINYACSLNMCSVQIYLVRYIIHLAVWHSLGTIKSSRVYIHTFYVTFYSYLTSQSM